VKTTTYHFLRQVPFSIKGINQSGRLIKKYRRAKGGKNGGRAAK
jgi:hypothetical protein